MADRLVETAGAALFGGDPSMDKGIQAMHRWLVGAGIPSGDVLLDTGSGLSYTTRLTAKQIVHVLRVAGGHAPRDSREPNAEVFTTSLSVGGVDGTLRGRFRGTPGQVFAKTGTLTFAARLPD